MSNATLILAAVAGILSTLSPCVFPLLPIVLASARCEHRWGPIALAAGLAVSFAGIGITVASIGFSFGFDGEFFRTSAAVLMILFGSIILLPQVQTHFAIAAGPVVNWTHTKLWSMSSRGLPKAFLVGILLGAVWSPCVGPTLGAATVLAAQGRDPSSVALIMFTFGLGATMPLLLIGLLSREVAAWLRPKLISGRHSLRSALGIALIMLGVLVTLGLDKIVEAKLVGLSPHWLTSLTVAY